MRAAFEAWHISQYGYPPPIPSDHTGAYLDSVEQSRWKAFQAGCSTLQSELSAERIKREAAERRLCDVLAEADHAFRADAERYRWLKECTNEQFEYLEKEWCGLDNAIDYLMMVERNA